ncbi:hypothetical protein KNP414_03908 [Paenibacillus mucilaginosus KNP414]|uniref:Uncharacterized protein n=1 Tax=Paenibacillus mucilaginosus (strain KNP414) TaxID=1036673 RepID=F8F8Z8_PAEMK|nr:hypothetical protein KNP414_03908 [Paenibacillus mucilaginosus KNP414]
MQQYNRKDKTFNTALRPCFAGIDKDRQRMYFRWRSLFNE